MYPNPFSDIVNLEVTGLDSQQFELTVFNTAMMLLIKQHININSDQFYYQLNLHNLPAGVYFINLKNEYTNIIQKIVKRKALLFRFHSL